MSMRRIGVGALVAVAAMAGASDALAAGIAPASLSAPPKSIAAGRSFTVTVTVSNAGRRRARATRVAAFLSEDVRRGKGDVRLNGALKVGTVKPGERRTVHARLTVPGTAEAGRYHLIACAAGRCLAAQRLVRVTRERSPAVTIPAPRGGSTPAPGGSSTPGGSADPTPSPLTVGAETLDTAHAATRTMFSGTLTTTAADGTRYTLTIPSGALTASEDITLTPVTHVAGLPFAGGLIGAVDLQPSGLALIKAATLTIQPPAGAPSAAPTAFDFQQGGSDFHLYPMATHGTLTLGITHFSTPGVAAATDAERAAVLAHTPARANARLEQELAAGQTPALQLSTVTGHYDRVVQPGLQAASTADSKAPDAIFDALQWARQAEVLGIGGDAFTSREQDMWALVEIVMRNAVDQGYARCANHDPTEIVRLMQIQREALLLGLDIGDAFGKALACAHFELDFDARYTKEDHTYGTDHAPIDATGAWKMQAQVPVDISGVATAPLTWVEHSFDMTAVRPCAVTGTLTTKTRLVSADGGTVQMQLQLDINPREVTPPGQPAPPAPVNHLVITPQGTGLEHYTVTNSGCTSSSNSYTDWLWWQSLLDFHPSQARIALKPGTGTGAILDSQTISAAMGGRPDRDSPGLPAQTELMHVDVLHTPQSAP